ncbi:hypothetical protein WA1_48230 [Scytonema hofmannii PCC 7110]|uniref:Uncharacterized protein n=1 Tax=Scytonema hofmannii PCC 7110 TaxID=128403 RepID=A0A139WY88_9CYAN|nr:hypothetical protein [Scytonema hofmannii]KYC37396.1 hypothetical protein WA1_48230 [Scytonema hofmannii PCC 7110]
MAICEHHHYPLVTLCPSCHHTLSIIAANSRPGYCHHCGEWLGNLEQSQPLHTLSQNELKLQSDFINIFGSLIAFTPSASENSQKKFYRQVITYFQVKELEDIELSNSQIPQKRIHKSLTYTGRTVKDFWKSFSLIALETVPKS